MLRAEGLCRDSTCVQSERLGHQGFLYQKSGGGEELHGPFRKDDVLTLDSTSMCLEVVKDGLRTKQKTARS